MDEMAALEILRVERLLGDGDTAGAETACKGLQTGHPSLPEVRNLLGQIALARADAEAAVQAFKDAIALDERIAVFHLNLGNALQDLGKLDRAIAAYRRALKLKPDLAAIHNDLGTAYFAKGLAAEAEACYRRAIRLDPLQGIATENLGALLRRQRRLREAREVLQRALRLRVSTWVRRALGRIARFSLLQERTDDQDARSLIAAAESLLGQGHRRVARALAAAVGSKRGLAPGVFAPLARLERRLGRTSRAIAHLHRAIELDSWDADLQAELAELLVTTGSVAEAEQRYRAALRLKPRLGKALGGFGNLLSARGRHAEALEVLGRRLEVEPRCVAAYVDRARAEIVAGKIGDAERDLARAIALDPTHPGARVILGDLLLAKGKPAEAAEQYGMALQREPDFEPATIGVAQALFALGNVEAAIAELRRLVEVRPGSARAQRQLGGMLRDSAATAQALPHLEQALRLDPTDPDALRFLGNALSDLGRYAEARERLEAALALAPWRSDLWNELGMFELFSGRLSEAQRDFERAIELRPDLPALRNNLGQTLLAQERLEEGWALLDYRAQLAGHAELHDRFPLPRWSGEPLAQKSLLVYGEQGLGDEILFASCIPDLASTARRIIVECDPRLEHMFRRSFPQVEVRSGDRKRAGEWYESLDPNPDLQIGAGSLPRHLRPRMTDFPRHSGYLNADPERVAAWRKRLMSLGADLCVGISWKGGFVRTGELRRTLAPDRLVPLLKVPGVVFVNLQYTDARADLARLFNDHGISVLHWQEAIDNYEDTAALVCALDGVISVCTALVHLTGALGRPAWVIAPRSPGWRYLIAGRNPWYPSVEVFEQPEPGDWDSVLRAVQLRLAAAASGEGFRAHPDRAPAA